MSVTHILDGSHYQGHLSVAALRKLGPDIVIWKCTEGSGYTDPSYTVMKTRIRSAAVLGAYHFARPGQSSAASQARRFLAHAGLRSGEVAVLDLEASSLGQGATRGWMHAFGDYLRTHHDGPTWVYLGGYAANGSGRDAADHFGRWWYPRYRSMDRVNSWAGWPPFRYPAGGGTTGWRHPHVWQFTDDFRGFGDASVSPLTVAQLTGGDPMPTAKEIAKEVWEYQFEHGSVDSSYTKKKYTANFYLAGTNAWIRRLVHKQLPEINEKEIAQEVLTGLDASAIADAVAAQLPADEAQQVVDALAERLGQ